MTFKKYLQELGEEIVSSDIATVDSKLSKMHKRPDKHLVKGKKCKKHKRVNCEECEAEKYGDEY